MAPFPVSAKHWFPSTLSVVVVRQVQPYVAMLAPLVLIRVQPVGTSPVYPLEEVMIGCSNPPFTSRFVSAKPAAGGVYGSGRLRIVPVMPFTMKARPAQSPG